MQKTNTIYCGSDYKNSKYIVLDFCIWLFFSVLKYFFNEIQKKVDSRDSRCYNDKK